MPTRSAGTEPIDPNEDMLNEEDVASRISAAMDADMVRCLCPCDCGCTPAHGPLDEERICEPCTKGVHEFPPEEVVPVALTIKLLETYLAQARDILSMRSMDCLKDKV